MTLQIKGPRCILHEIPWKTFHGKSSMEIPSEIFHGDSVEYKSAGSPKTCGKAESVGRTMQPTGEDVVSL